MQNYSLIICSILLVTVLTFSGCAITPHPVADCPTRLEVRFLQPEDISNLRNLYHQGKIDVGHAASIDSERRYDVDESLVYTAHVLMTDPAKRDSQHLNKVVNLLNGINKETLQRTLEKSLYIADLRPSVLNLSKLISHPNLRQDLARFFLAYGDKSMAQDFLDSDVDEYVDAGKKWLKKSRYPVPRDLPRVMVVEVSDADLEEIASRLRQGDKGVNNSQIIDNLVYAGTTCIDQRANWVNRSRGRKIYDILKNMDHGMVGDGIARQVIFLSYRDQLLFFGVKLGIPGSEEKLNKILMIHGDMTMAEDFLNSSSAKLADGGRSWAAAHGYRVSTGFGSHRTRWGSF